MAVRYDPGHYTVTPRKHRHHRKRPTETPVDIVAAGVAEGVRHPHRRRSHVARRATIAADAVAEELANDFSPPRPTATDHPDVAAPLPIDRTSPTSYRSRVTPVVPPTHVDAAPTRLTTSGVEAERPAPPRRLAATGATGEAGLTSVRAAAGGKDVAKAERQAERAAAEQATLPAALAVAEILGGGARGEPAPTEPIVRADPDEANQDLVVGGQTVVSVDEKPEGVNSDPDVFMNPVTGRPDRRANYAPGYEQFYRQLTGVDPYGSNLENAAALGEFGAEFAAGGALGKAAEGALAARTVVAGAADYAPYLAKVGLKPATKGTFVERLAGVGTKGYTARAGAAAQAAKAIRRGEQIGNAAVGETVGVPRALAREIGFAAKGRYVGAARAARRANRAERALNSINPATGAVIPGTDQGRAFIEGSANALDPTNGNLIDTIATTGRVIPASLAYPVTALADTVETGGLAAQNAAALITGQEPPNTTSEVLGPVRGAAEEGISAFVEPAKALVSGDPARVQDTIQNQVGLFGLPLLPRALSGRTAKAFGTKVSEAIPTGTPPGRVTDVGGLRRARQIIEGKGVRKSISEMFAEEGQVSQRQSHRAEREIETELRKIPGYPTMKAALSADRKGERFEEPGDLLNPLVRFGITREGGIGQLRHVVETLGESARDPMPGVFTMRDALDYAERHPEVMADQHLWNAVEVAQKTLDKTATSPRAARLGQAAVFGVPHPEHVTPFAARPHTEAKLKVDAEKDLANTRKSVKADRREAAKLRTEARAQNREAKVYELADSRRRENKVRTAAIKRLEGRKEKWQAKLEAAKTPAQRKLAKAALSRIDVELASRRSTPASKARIRRLERAGQLKREAGALEEKAKADSERATNLEKALDPYLRSTSEPSIRTKRIAHTERELKEFVDEVDAAAADHPLGPFDEPRALSERDPGHLQAEALGSPATRQGSRAPHISNFKTGRADVADRGLRTFIADSVYRPRLQAAVHRFISRVLAKHAVALTVDGKRVYEVTSREAQKQIAEKKIDPREIVFLPKTAYKRAIEHANFEPGVIHDSIVGQLGHEMQMHDAVKGDKYVALKREAAIELAAQLDPTGGFGQSSIMRGLNKLASPLTRLILMSPAWALSQVVAEGLQAGVAINPLRLAAAERALRKLKKEDPEGYAAFADIAGESNMVARTPHDIVPNMHGDTQRKFRNAGRALRRTKAGRAMYTAGTGQLFSIFDRYKTGKLRQVVLAAHAHKGFNKFVEGVQGMTKEADKIAQAIEAKGSYPKQLKFIAENPQLFEKHREYVNDVLGNWEAFTRFERQAAPFLIFYPFLRMGLRWAFWSYPKNHPIKAQILYMLAQRNAEEIEKLTGGAANFLSYAVPVVHGKEGNVDAVLPAGQRFGAPGLNSLIEAVGTQNVTGLMRLLNPALSVGASTVTGINPLSGVQEVKPTDPLGHALLGAQQLLTMAAPLRPLTQGADPETGAQAKAAELDPAKVLRSSVVPFLPQDAGDFAEQQILNSAYRESGVAPRSEISQFLALPAVKKFTETGDPADLQGELGNVASATGARDFIKTELEGMTDATTEARIETAIDAYYAVKGGDDPTLAVPDPAATGGLSPEGIPYAAPPTAPTTPEATGVVPGATYMDESGLAPTGTYEEMLRKSAAAVAP